MGSRISPLEGLGGSLVEGEAGNRVWSGKDTDVTCVVCLSGMAQGGDEKLGLSAMEVS